jgi:hypothetical protein
MIHKLMESIRHMKEHSTGFEEYLTNVQRSGQQGGVKIDEARKDYQRALLSRDRYLIG